jgi:outer membrane protein
MNRINSKLIQSTLAALLVASSATFAADEAKDFTSRIGVVNSERIFKESNMAKASQAKLQAEIAKREKD